MAKLIDLTGQRFGKLVVLERDTDSTKNGTYWKCRCDCGNIISTRKDTLTRKTNPKTSCGCDIKEKNSMAHLKDETGNRYGKLTVLYRVENRNGSKNARWHCQCDCGNECDVDGAALRNGTVQSCGCKLYESKNIIDETGNRYGKLIVLYKSDKTNNSHHVFWHCKCDCGNECDIDGVYLRNGMSSNCGCERSVGETKIKKLLKENNILFKREYTFPDLFGIGGGKLRFDFGILDNRGNLLYLIEYDGVQHFKPNCFGDDKLFSITKEHDRLKTEYCKNNSIPLIRIPYTHLSKITIQDLILEAK